MIYYQTLDEALQTLNFLHKVFTQFTLINSDFSL